MYVHMRIPLYMTSIDESHLFDIANLDDILIPDLFSVYDNNYVNISCTDISTDINDYINVDSVIIPYVTNILDLINDVQNYISINNIDNSEILCQQLLNIKSRVDNYFL